MAPYLFAFSVMTPALAAGWLWNTHKLRRRNRELELRSAETAREAGEWKRKAEEAGSAQTKFLANMSHEIRTPMSGIIGMTDLLVHTPLGPEQREYADTIGSSGRALLGIIDDVLDLARIHDGRMRVACATFDLCRTLEEVVTAAAPAAEGKHIELVMRYAPGVPRMVAGDEGRIRQVLLNLIGNAVKFTDRGYALAEVTPETITDRACTLRVTVEDTGVGVPEKEGQKLFHAFERAESAARFEGAGLGLAISKKLVESMGGRIGFDSRLGAGSTFWFTLPLRLDPAARQPQVPPLLLDSPLRVLVAAAKSAGRKVLDESLVQLGMRMDHVEAPEDVLPAMRLAHDAGAPFGLLMLDLPAMGAHGHALAQGVRRDPRLKGAAIVLLSSEAGSADARRLAQFVNGSHLSKPVLPSALDRALASLLFAAKPSSDPVGPPLTLEEVDAARWTWNVLLAEDNAINQRVALAQLKSLGCRVELAANGREAVEKLRENSYDLVFMDCIMPEMDGFEAARLIRRMEDGSRRTVIVAMTARAYAEDRERCHEAGMDDYLAKPVLAEDMRRVLERWKPAQPA